MPKRVDHERRRAEFAAALVRRARTQGLHSVGFRDVAAEAGVSVNLVQYYFPTKEQLLQGGLVHLRTQLNENLRRGLDSDDPVHRVRHLLLGLLPGDDVSTDLYCVHAAYAALAMTDPALAAQPHVAGPDELHPWLTNQLRAAQRSGRMAEDQEPHQTATTLLALSTGLAAYVVSGYLPLHEAHRTLLSQLDRILLPAPVG